MKTTDRREFPTTAGVGLAAAFAMVILIGRPALAEDAAAGAAPATERLATFHHSEQVSRAPCSAVWSVLSQRTLWLSGFTSETLLRGRAGEVGEVTRVITTLQGQALPRLERTLLSEPGRRRVIAMEPEGIDMLGFVEHRLTPQAGGCRIELALSLTQVPPAGVDGYEAIFSSGTQQKVATDLARLVRLAEENPGATP
jgi:hypothetical protein